MQPQYSNPPYGYQGPGAYYGLRASMNPTSNPLAGAPQTAGVYPTGVPPVGQWGSHPVPHGQVGYSASAVPGGVVPYSVVPPTAPSYTPPAKSSKQSKQQPNIPPPPKAPERPLQPYMRYSKENFEKVKAENQELKLQDISRILGARWKALVDKDKQRYVDEWEAEKVTYGEQLKLYHNSPAYKAWVETKHQAELQAKRAAMMEQQRAYTPPPPQVIPTPQMTGMSVAPVEDEECEFTTMQQVAAARYQRNHRLMAEIFNDVVIPVIKPSVDESKLSSLSEQVETLTQHQKKLEVELEEMEAVYQRKRRKVRKDGQHFLMEMKRLRETPLSLPNKKGPPPAKIPPLPATDAKYITL